MTHDAYEEIFERRNLLSSHRWSIPGASAAAKALLNESRERDALVLLGSKVAAAFGLVFREQLFRLEPAAFGPGRSRLCVVLPHPSGLSREWNIKGAPERAAQLVRECLAATRGVA
jgi:hypothetical protein